MPPSAPAVTFKLALDPPNGPGPGPGADAGVGAVAGPPFEAEAEAAPGIAAETTACGDAEVGEEEGAAEEGGMVVVAIIVGGRGGGDGEVFFNFEFEFGFGLVFKFGFRFDWGAGAGAAAVAGGAADVEGVVEAAGARAIFDAGGEDGLTTDDTKADADAVDESVPGAGAEASVADS